MKDVKSLFLIAFSFLLFVVSFFLLWTWGYRFYIKPNSANTNTAAVPSAPVNAVTINRDSLQHIYSATINSLDTRFDSTWKNVDSLKSRLDLRLAEFYRLRNEIEILLKQHGSDSSLETARQKITELQQRVKDLLDKNLDVEYENKKLVSVLEQLGNNRKNPSPAVQKASFDNIVAVPENSETAPVFTVTDLRLTAMMQIADKDQETNLAQQTDKLEVSCMIRNNSGPVNNSDVMVVLIRPDGQVMKNSTWESGMFMTKDGRKIYSYKLRSAYNSGETRLLNFSISADKYQSGNYTLQVYHNGMLIGKIQKNLS